MEKNKTQNLKGLLTACVLAVGLLLAYQNCGEVTEKAIFPSTAAISTYPFDYKVDSVGMMTCDRLSPGSYNRNYYFSFKAGVYRARGGLKISDGFRSSVQSQGLTVADAADRIRNDTQAAGAKLQFSMRSRQFARDNPAGIVGQENVNVYGPPLDSLSESLLNRTAGSRLTNFNGATMTGFVSFAEGDFTQAMSYLQTGEYGLYSAFQTSDATTTSPKIAGPSALIKSQAYAAVIDFSRVGFINANNPWVPIAVPGSPRVMNNGVKQIDGVSFAQLDAMVCPPEGQYRVVENRAYSNTGTSGNSAGYVLPDGRAADARPLNYCNPNGSSDGSAAYQVARAMLDPSYWVIDQVNRCIIATSSAGGTCYPSAYASQNAINWNAGTTNSGNYGNAAGRPHFFSVCYVQ
jgi:hypothetical protein